MCLHQPLRQVDHARDLGQTSLAFEHTANGVVGKGFVTCTLCRGLELAQGGALGYLVGAQMLENIGRPILKFYGKTDSFDSFKDAFNAQGVWAVLFAGVTPFPYKVITITSGATGLNFAAFMGFSLVARGVRFFLVAALLRKFGAPARVFIEKRLGLMATLFMVLLIGGFFLVKYL